MSEESTGKKSAQVVQLGAKVRSRRDEVLEDLFRRHQEPLRRFLRVRLGADAQIDDIFQEVYLRLARVDDLIEKVNRHNGSTRAYIFSIANNLIIDRGRRNTRRRELGLTTVDELPDPVDSITPERETISDEQLQRVRKVIESMRPNWRRALLLHRFRRMSYRQVAEEMGVSAKRVEKYIAAALRVLREDRERYEKDHEQFE